MNHSKAKLEMVQGLSKCRNRILTPLSAKVDKSLTITLFSLWISLIIGLAGATADVHCYDVLSNKWTRYSVSEIVLIPCNVVLRLYVFVIFFS
jgi:hypothetical protein